MHEGPVSVVTYNTVRILAVITKQIPLGCSKIKLYLLGPDSVHNYLSSTKGKKVTLVITSSGNMEEREFDVSEVEYLPAERFWFKLAEIKGMEYEMYMYDIVKVCNAHAPPVIIEPDC